jgi:hypothetical protein
MAKIRTAICRACITAIVFLLTIFHFACGETSITIDESTYEPKIVIMGYLYPEMPVTDIKITRNFPIGTVIDKDKVPLRDANVQITDLDVNTSFQLAYNQQQACFEYSGSDLMIDYNKSYELRVDAVVDGEALTAQSVTTIPDKGLTINRDQSVYGDMYYRQKDNTGSVISPRVAYEQSPNTSFYLLSISSTQANIDSFIYENPFGFDIQDALDGGAKIEDFQYRVRWTRPENINDGYSVIEINWFQIWFYGPYRLLLYAGDENFFHFYNTHRNVQEIDGNLHEPIFDIEGDGIGVFGSAVVDTLYLNVLPNE